MVITITKLAGPNAVVNGVFVDPETATATFVKEDTTTRATGSVGTVVKATISSAARRAAQLRRAYDQRCVNVYLE